MDAACWLPQLVVQLVDCGCFHDVPEPPPKLLVDFMPVGIVGSDGLKALAVAPVSLATNGMVLLRTPICWLFFAPFDLVFLHCVLFFSMWLRGRMNCM